MAKTIINLTDQISTLVTKTNTISSHIGDITQLNTTGADSDIVQAINAINVKADNTDSSTILSLIGSNSMDSSEVLAIITADSGSSSIISNFQKDSANGIGLDSSQGRFFVPINTLTISKFSNPVTLLIKDSAGSTLKTIRSPGS